MSNPDDLAFARPLIEALERHRVRFVLIGGVAARLQGSPSVTDDVDVCYARDDDNLERLAAALRELHATLRGRGIPPDLPFLLDAMTLKAGDHFTFTTDVGPLDILGTPSGSSGFDELDRAAMPATRWGLDLRVASIDHLIRMKLAAGRPKDLIEVEVLGALRDEIDEQAAEARRERRREKRERRSEEPTDTEPADG